MAKCKLKTHICVKEESRNNQGRGVKPREQLRKHLRDVVNIVVRTRNRSGHGKRYSLAVGDIYGIGCLPFLAYLIATALPTAKGGDVAAVQLHAGHAQEKPITVRQFGIRICLEKFQLPTLFNAHRQCLGLILEDTVCCQCRTEIHEEVMYGAMA